MVKFWDSINKVISDADIILEVLDAKLINETRNSEIEDKVKRAGKPLIYVINKADAVQRSQIIKNKQNLHPSIFVSAKEKRGINELRTLIMSKSGSKKEVKVGVLGYPNTGKSSLINALGGGGKARTSSQSGFTKGHQDIRLSQRLKVIDTPGVIPYKENDSVKHALTSTVDYAHIKDPDMAVFELMRRFPGKIEEYYDVYISDDLEETLEEIAIVKNKLRSGGNPDFDAVSRMILKDWQAGKIKIKN